MTYSTHLIHLEPSDTLTVERNDTGLIVAATVSDTDGATVARSTDVTQARALKRAREIADARGLPLPNGLDEVAGEVLDALVADLGLTIPAGDPRNRKMWAHVADAWPDEDQQGRDNRRLGLIAFVADGATSSKDLDETGWRDLFDSLELIKDGAHEMVLSANNRWTFQPKRANPRPAAKKATASHRSQA